MNENLTQQNENPEVTTEERIVALESSSASFSNMLVMCLTTVFVTLLIGGTLLNAGIKRGFFQQQNQSKVVYLDFEKVIGAGIKDVMNKDRASLEDTKGQAEAFQAGISRVLHEYTNDGYVVVNKKALIEGSAAFDITPVMIQKLGLQQ